MAYTIYEARTHARKPCARAGEPAPSERGRTCPKGCNRRFSDFMSNPQLTLSFLLHILKDTYHIFKTTIATIIVFRKSTGKYKIYN